MKYSIFGFNQKAVLEVTKEVMVEQKAGEYPKYKTLKLDCIDLLILQDVADFMNRKKIIKYTIDDKIYFSIHYSAIIEDLPILGIKQQALSDRLSKLVELNLLEKAVIKNQAGSFVAFRLGEKYERLKYTPNERECCTSIELPLQTYQTTSAKVADYTPKYSSTNNSSTNNYNKEKDIDKSISEKKANNSTWRADIEVYRKEVEDAKEQLINDTEFKAKFMNMYPNADYLRSIMKSMQYWTSEKAWELKKKGKSSKINMLATLKNNLEKSVVYKNSQDQPIENLRMLNIEYKDKQEGTLADGTFIKGAYRYYFSYREKRALSIPINAPMMPSERCEYDYNSKNWYLPRESETINDLLW